MTVEQQIRIIFLFVEGLKLDFLTGNSSSHRLHNMLFSEYHVLSVSKPVKVLRVRENVPRVRHVHLSSFW